MEQDPLEEAVRALLRALGEDPEREGLRETPRRVARFYREFLAGARQDPTEPLETAFAEDFGGLVVVRDIPFYSLCEHHLLPFCGTAHLGYLPSGVIAGASKLVRTLTLLARRLQVQERLTRQVADALEQALRPRGVAVVLSAEHLCMTMRGVQKPGSRIVTVCARGALREEPARWAQFASLVGLSAGSAPVP